MSPANPTTDLTRVIERWVMASPAKVALHWEGIDLTYGDLWARIEATAQALDVKKGERVAYLGYNDPQQLFLLFAAARRGAIFVPLNWRLTAAEHQEILADCAPRWLFCGAEFAEHAAALGVPLGSLDHPAARRRWRAVRTTTCSSSTPRARPASRRARCSRRRRWCGTGSIPSMRTTSPKPITS
jgi:acyl-CoA synthetase (AMP-forming)/AMP-acid ligase II